MKKLSFPLVSLFLLLLTACYNQATTGDQGAIDVETQLKGDSTRYGLACDGCSDSVIVLLPNEGGDPVKFDIVTVRLKSGTNWRSYRTLSTRMRRRWSSTLNR